MRVLNLFDGIGGFALAAEWMGWQNVGSCEIDPFCRRVLDYHFDYEYVYTDIKSADFTALRGRIDLITGGFPCQPFSCAGSRKGTDDNRYLWPQMLRAIREIQPRWVVAENVRGLLSIENSKRYKKWRNKQMSKKKVFVSLPITGRVEESRLEAKRVKEKLSEKGYEVVTPFDVAPLPNQPESYYMGNCVKALMECDYITQKPSATLTSRGCTVEACVARQYDIEWLEWETKVNE